MRLRLMLGAAFAAIGLIPVAPALADEPDVSITTSWTQDINVDLDWTVGVDKDLEVIGTIIHTGIVDSSAVADPLEQILTNQILEMDYDNSLSVVVDAATIDPNGQNEQAGDENVQENRSVLAPAAASTLQSLIGNIFGFDSIETAHVNDAVDLDVSASDAVINDVGLNTAAGAFNLQANSSILAIVPADSLADSTADLQQNATLNSSILTDVANELMTTVILEDASANVGVNSVSGIGNEQLNIFTVTIPF